MKLVRQHRQDVAAPAVDQQDRPDGIAFSLFKVIGMNS